jgi:hypothetical protein
VVSEQVLSFALEIADRFLVIEKGRFVIEETRDRVDEATISRYLSVKRPRQSRRAVPHLRSVPSLCTRLPSRSQSMTETLIKVDLNQPVTRTSRSTTAGTRTSRWRAGSSRATTSSSRPTTGPAARSRTTTCRDVRDVDLSTVHLPVRPGGRAGAEPGDLLVVDLLDIGAKADSQWGFNGFFSRQNGGGFLTDHFPSAQKSIWDFKGMFTSSRHIPG